MLEEFYRTGEFPYTMFNPGAGAPKPIQHIPLRYALLNSIFIFATLSLILITYSLVTSLKNSIY